MSSYRMKYKIGATQYNIPVVDDMAGFGSGVPLGTILPYPANSEYPPEGFLWCDGSAVSRAAYPDLFALIGTTYGSGDGTTTFNLPDLGFCNSNDIDSFRPYLPVYGVTGTYPNSGTAPYFVDCGSTAGSYRPYGGVTSKPSYDKSEYNNTYLFADLEELDKLKVSASIVKYIIKAFSATSSNSELVDVTELSTEITKKADYRTDWCYIYPNNGTAQNPANITASARYVESNPFSGYLVYCQVELYVNSEWGSPGWYSDYRNGTFVVGVRVAQHNNDSIVVQSGMSYIAGGSLATGGTLVGTDAGVSSAPCRVKVWKIGKLPT